jgi:hypothetical protein
MKNWKVIFFFFGGQLVCSFKKQNETTSELKRIFDYLSGIVPLNKYF